LTTFLLKLSFDDSFLAPLDHANALVDFDLGDGGMEQLAEWETVHGAFTGPRVRTGSGGVHVYFSHEKSLQAGLGSQTPTHFAKLEFKVLDPESGEELIKKWEWTCGALAQMA
jgi:hypothetical protein